VPKNYKKEKLMEILSTIITSSIVTGILVFVFKESYKHKLDILIKDLDFLRNHQSKDFTKVQDSFSEVWSLLVELEDYLNYNLSVELQSGNISNKEFRKKRLLIKQNSIWLPESLHDKTNIALNNIANHFESTVNQFVKAINEKKPELRDNEKILEDTNQALKTLNLKTKEELETLKKEFRQFKTSFIESQSKR
jgi:hypothetical protein